MSLNRFPVFLTLALGAFCSSSAGAVADYDARPFLQALSPAWKARMPSALGLDSLSHLPLYQMSVRLRPVSSEVLVELEINYKNTGRAPLDRLVLRTLANSESISPRSLLSVREVKINGVPASFSQPHPTVLRLELSPPLAGGERVLVNISCRTEIPFLPESSGEDVLADLTGSNNAGYGILGQARGVFNLALFYPLLAARQGAVWDEEPPASLGDPINLDPANFLVRLRLPRAMRVAFTGLQLGEQPLGSGPEAERELYLMATAVRHFALHASSRYLELEKNWAGVKLRVLALDEDRSTAEKMLAESEKVLKAFSSWLGAYPYASFQLAEAPLAGGAGGMEYPGMAAIASQLLHPQQGGPLGALLDLVLGQAQTVEFVLAHEAAHQWFHALVGSDSRRHPFVDEAPANYLAVMYLEKAYGSSAAENQLGLQLLSPIWLWRILGGTDGVVDRPAEAFANLLEYSALVYGKGALFFHKLRLVMGREKFLDCLKALCARFAFRHLTPAELKEQLAFCHPQAASLFERWLRGRHLEEDLAQLGLDLESGLERLLGLLGSLQGFHNFKFDGPLPAGTLELFQEAVRQLSGGP